MFERNIKLLYRREIVEPISKAFTPKYSILTAILKKPYTKYIDFIDTYIWVFDLLYAVPFLYLNSFNVIIV